MTALMTDAASAFTVFVLGTALFALLMVTGIYLAIHSYDQHERRRRHLPWHHA